LWTCSEKNPHMFSILARRRGYGACALSILTARSPPSPNTLSATLGVVSMKTSDFWTSRITFSVSSVTMS